MGNSILYILTSGKQVFSMKIRFEELKTSLTSAISRRTYVQLFSMNSLKSWNTIKALRVVSVLYALFHIFFKKTRIISPISPEKRLFSRASKRFFHSAASWERCWSFRRKSIRILKESPTVNAKHCGYLHAFQLNFSWHKWKKFEFD